jgi:eukaryotic-like serine/threonine-protein kinase
VTHILPDRYRHPERIARGGMGDIYRAEDGILARTVAIKVLSDRFADEEGVRRRFTREALAAARLSTAPSTVTIFDVGEHEGRPYIVMEYLAGGSLADRIDAEGAQPPARALPWLRQAAAALDAAHAKGIVHRDVKPANLLLDEDGNVHVADFGIASAVGLDSFTAAGTILGTAGYLAPEQARGEQTTPASDRYALAVVAFELLTGTRPFASDSPTAEASAHVHGEIPRASERNPELPLELDAALAHGLAKDPERRFGSCAELVHALSEALDAAAGRTTIAAAAAPVREGSRRRAPLLAAATVALALGGVAVAAALVDGDEQTAGTTAPRPKTVQKTVTAEGTTVVRTVTTAPPATTTEPEPTTTAPTTTAPAGDAASLNDQGFALMQAGDYEAALPLLEQSVSGLSGSGGTAEAYASYNLAFTRLALGSCDGVLELLDRSEAIQGRRREIDGLRKDARKSC